MNLIFSCRHKPITCVAALEKLAIFYKHSRLLNDFFAISHSFSCPRKHFLCKSTQLRMNGRTDFGLSWSKYEITCCQAAAQHERNAFMNKGTETGFAKGHLSRCERWLFTMRFAVFCKAVCRLSFFKGSQARGIRHTMQGRTRVPPPAEKGHAA